MRIKKVVNISDRVLNINNISIKPLDSYIWDEYNFSERLLNRLNVLQNLKFIKVFNYDQDDIVYNIYRSDELISDNIEPQIADIETITNVKPVKRNTKKNIKGDK